MRIRNIGTSGTRRGVTQDLLPMPASMQQHSAGTREQIAKNAYELYEQRGRQDGQDLDDRLQVMRALHETKE